MARLRASESAEASDHASLYRESSVQIPRESVEPSRPHSSAVSPSPDRASDKENEASATRTTKISMAPPPLPTGNSDFAMRAAKRRRLSERDSGVSLTEHANDETEAARPTQAYDPDQNIEERRRLRKGFRELEKETTDNKAEWMDPNSTGLRDAISKADHYFREVKQTSDATLDSRILVAAGDLTHKRAQQTVLGDGTQGVDVDDFVTKCIGFMRLADDDQDHIRSQNTTVHRRRRAAEAGSDDEDGPDYGDALNWDWLGSRACFLDNKRPPVPSFLLGPLSLQKRTRAQRTRRERSQRNVQGEATRPQELKESDLESQENSNLTKQCSNIYSHLKGVIGKGTRKAQEEAEELGEDMTEEDEKAILERNHLADDGGVPFFKSVINPKSFGQTVENLFYVSFLIKDGMMGMHFDGDDMPTLHDTQEEQGNRNRAKDAQRHQAVFSLDFETWKQLSESLEIERSLIPTREEDDTANNIGNSGWYS